jgi:mannosylglycerate hydrolase
MELMPDSLLPDNQSNVATKDFSLTTPATAADRPQPPFTGIVVNHTHWDREWYMPFQRYRVMLVDAIDHLLDILKERADYAGFTLDGQTVVVEDYLEIRPEKQAELVEYVRSGRVELGPWYVLPDGFIPSAESLVRNLLLGRRQMTALHADPAKVGYLPDTFGHPGQLPQVLASMDLNSAIIFRGVKSPTSEFIWQAPDGTKLLTIYLPGGYYNAMELARSPGYWLREKLIASLEQLTGCATTGTVLLMNGCDHFEPQPATQEFLDQANRLQDQVYLKQGTLGEYIDLVRQANPELRVETGEWRYNRPARITPGVLSTRMYLKQADFRSSILLERGAEPLQALAWMLGGHHDTGLLNTAWRYLLQNHPHDSICGCSVDAVHKDGEARYRWVQEIGSDLVERAVSGLAARTGQPDAAGSAEGLLVFNTLATPRTETVHQQLHFLQPGVIFRLEDGNGQPVEFQEISRQPIKIQWDPQRRLYHCDGRSRPALVVSRPDPAHVEERWQRWLGEEVDVLIKADLPAGGYASLKIIPVTGQTEAGRTQPPETNPVLENELIRVETAPDGSFKLLDKASGRSYGPLNVFRSEADRGDEYSFCPALDDTPVSSLNGQATVKMVESGPVRSTLEIRLALEVPARLAPDRTRRVAEKVTIPVCTRVSLSPGQRRVGITTELDNTGCDHRLRALFATGVHTEVANAQGQFMVVSRPADLSADERARVPEFDEEQEVNYHPQRAFVDVSDQQGGLAVLNRGLPEYEAETTPDGIWLGLTLLRSVGWLSRDDLSTRYKHAGPPLETPEAQCLGRHRFDYAVVPHQGDWLVGRVAQEAEAFVTPVYSTPLNLARSAVPARQSFYRLEPDELLFSTCKRSEDGEALVLRAYNTAPHPVEAVLHLGLNGQVRHANLAERQLSDNLAPDGDGTYRFQVRPHEIFTLLVRDKEEKIKL